MKNTAVEGMSKITSKPLYDDGMVERFEKFSYAIMEISRCWHKLASDEMEKYGLKGSHSVYLLTIARSPQGLTAPQICELCGRDKSDVSRMMSIMEKNGLVIKEIVSKTRYGGVFHLTEAGLHAAEKVAKRASLAVEIAGKELSEQGRTILYDALSAITVNLQNLCKDGIPLADVLPTSDPVK